jgi:integrase
MTRKINRLSARRAQTLTKPGRHADGGGLCLVVTKAGTKKWTFLYRRRRDAKLCEMGLGGFTAVSLARARQKAAALRALLADGKDPLESRKAARERIPTFGALAQEVIASLEHGWRNEVYRAQWRTSLQTHAAKLWVKRVDEVTTDDVLAVLMPIWRTKSKTASHVRGRIEKVLDAAKARGLRSRENPARWQGHLSHWLPKCQRLQRGHHPAMPWPEVPAFIARLRELRSVSALALEFIILTACRSGEVLRSVRDGEVRAARWDEFDHAARVWTIPAARTKANREHRVPLADRVLAILDELEKTRHGPFVFRGRQWRPPLSKASLEWLMRSMGAKPCTVHGFRSSFRDWAGECTNFPREIAEAALAHAVGDQTERAYRRGDALERRRELMQAWAHFCEPKVIHLDANAMAVA